MRYLTTKTTLAISFTLFALLPLSLFAGQGQAAEPGWFRMGMGLFGGLALFLFGMEQLAESLKSAVGKEMKAILKTLTTNRFTAAITGSIVTAVIQSSSVTTVLVVGFVSAGFMTLTQSIGVIMGANVGTTVTAQIVAFNVTEIALLFVASGFALLFTGKSDRIKHTGGMIMGLGLVFYGMSVMGDSMAPLKTFEPFLDLMQDLEKPLPAILVAAAFTALIQSSSATTGIVVVMASQGFITLPVGIAMALGANVGTCATAMMAAIGKTAEAVQAAATHITFNLAGVILWVGFIPELANIATALSPAHQELTGAARLAAETPRQIANANTLFNIANTVLFLPLAGLFALLVQKLIPVKPVIEELPIEPKYLDKELLKTASLALGNAQLELGRMGEQVIKQLAEAGKALNDRDPEGLKQAVQRDDKIDILHDAVIEYLGEIQKTPLSSHESEILSTLLKATIHLESIGDVIETDIAPLGMRLVQQEIPINEKTQPQLNRIFNSVQTSLERAVQAIKESDIAAAEEVLESKYEFRELERELRVLQSFELSEKPDGTVPGLRGEVELVERLHYIHSLAKWISRSVVQGMKKTVETPA